MSKSKAAHLGSPQADLDLNMVLCDKCNFSFDASVTPGGCCPRCLLLGVDEEHDEPVKPQSLTSRSVVEDEELTDELPGFEFEERIGRSAMSVVWRARERLLDRCVAIKFLCNVHHDGSFVDRFTREARVMARFHHPNIVILHSFGRTRSNHCYLIMELVEGTDLAHLMKQRVLTLPEILAITVEVCSALTHAHEAGFVHRDIKPGNVLIDHRGVVKVADFGLARLTRDNDPSTISITKQGFAVGTPHYIAPEQASGSGIEDHRADIFSLGVMLYEMITGELPRGVFGPPSQKFKTDKRVDKIIMRALQDEPSKRYQSVRELVADIQKVREAVDPVVIAERAAARRANRARQWFEMALAIFVALLLGIMLTWYSQSWLERFFDRPKAPSQARASAETPSLVPSIHHVLRLQPTSLLPGARFGERLTVWQDWMFVTASYDWGSDSSKAAVYVFRRDPEVLWKQVQVITPSASEALVQFPYMIDASDGLLVIGSPARRREAQGMVSIYELGADQQWRPNADAIEWPTERSYNFGISVSVAKTRFAVAEVRAGRSETVVYERAAQGQPWVVIDSFAQDYMTLSQTFNAHGDLLQAASRIDDRSTEKQGSGLVVVPVGKGKQAEPNVLNAPASAEILVPGFKRLSAFGDYAVLGSVGANNFGGAAWVAVRQPDGSYAHDSYLKAADARPGDEFGKSVSVLNDWCAIGADHYGEPSPHLGRVVLFKRNGSAESPWRVMAQLVASAEAGASDFGQSVALTPSEIIVGAANSGTLEEPHLTDRDHARGAVFVYPFDPSKPMITAHQQSAD